ncbi:PAS domain-containing protein [Gemmatimonadota bacterium]
MIGDQQTAPHTTRGAVAVTSSRFILHLLAGAGGSGLLGALWIFVIRSLINRPHIDPGWLVITECMILGAVAGVVVSWLTGQEYKKLLSRSALLERLVSGTSAGMWILDEDRRTIYSNQSMHQILGTVPRDRSHLQDFFTPENWQVIEQHLKMRPDGIASAYQVEVKRPNGDIRILQVLGSPIIVEPNRYLGSFGIFIDITDQILDQDRTVRKERLQTLIATVSRLNHKINNSLMVVRGQAEVLLRRDREGPDAEGYQRIITAADAIADELQTLTELENVEFEPLVGNNFMVLVPERKDKPASN